MAKWEGPELISSLCKFGHTKITEQVFAEQLVFSSFLKVCSEFCFNTVSFSGFFFFFLPGGMWNLRSQIRTEPALPALGGDSVTAGSPGNSPEQLWMRNTRRLVENI